jgi:hypothetical protein
MQTHALTQHQTKISALAKKNGITYLGLFGSYARGEQKKDSDIDLLVDFNKRYSLFDLIRVERSFSQVLKAPVDLIPADSLNKHVQPYVQKDLITIYDQR